MLKFSHGGILDSAVGKLTADLTKSAENKFVNAF